MVNHCDLPLFHDTSVQLTRPAVLELGDMRPTRKPGPRVPVSLSMQRQQGAVVLYRRARPSWVAFGRGSGPYTRAGRTRLSFIQPARSINLVRKMHSVVLK